MKKERLKQLLREYQAGTIKKNDLVGLLEYVANVEHEPVIDQLLAELMEEMDEDKTLSLASDSLYERITSHPHFHSYKESSRKLIGGKPIKLLYRWASAVAVVLVFLGCFWWYADQKSDLFHEEQYGEVRTVTSAPSDKLILKTSSGFVIDLDDQLVAGSTEIAAIHFSDDGSLTYDGEGNIVSPEEQHTIMTPKGRQYHIILSDGTKVWLNSATTMTFPAKFSGDLREITLDGEAYFEVKSAVDWPFVVHADQQKIEVLGTHFNVNAYSEDNIAYTTLLEGKVSVSARGQKKILRPGQQAKTAQSSIIEVTNVDVQDALAWKSNMFTFYDEEIQQVMRQVSRWYDVEVVYLDGMEGKRIGGSIPRFENIRELMEALQATGLLHYEMKGGNIIIKE